MAAMESDPEQPRPHVIPPPDLSPRPPAPLSPLDSLSAAARPPITPPPVMGGAPVQVRIRSGEGDAAEELQDLTASFNSRAVAAIIDMVVAGGLMMATIGFLPDFASKIGWLVGIGYILTRDSLPFLGGQSVGKKAMKLKAYTLDDQPLKGNWEAGLIRNMILVVPLLPLVELFVLLSREDKPGRGRRLGDEWAKTKVLTVPEPVAAEET